MNRFPELINLFANLAEPSETEQLDILAQAGGLRIERIVSQGHASPAEGWYDQHEREWVLVLSGAGRIAFEDGGEIELQSGDFLEIPARCRHRVSWTTPDSPTVWLAVFLDEKQV